MVIISDEIGIRKPNPKLFEYWLKKCDVKGLETIYIGDRIDKDIIPASINKIHGVYLHRGRKYDTYNSSLLNKEDFKSDYEINNLSEIFNIIDEINNRTYDY